MGDGFAPLKWTVVLVVCLQIGLIGSVIFGIVKGCNYVTSGQAAQDFHGASQENQNEPGVD